MTRPWKIVERIATAEGPLELRQRDREFLITVAGRVLMTSSAHRSEVALGALACAPVAARPHPRLLLGGLGMGFTLRAALDALPATATVVVVELTAAVAAWCRGPLAALSGDALADPRVTVRVGDVAREIRGAGAGAYDAIALDLYEGPNAATQTAADPFYGTAALAAARAALRKDGVLAIWSEDPDAAFQERFGRAGFRVTVHRSGRGGRTHIVYLGQRGA